MRHEGRTYLSRLGNLAPARFNEIVEWGANFDMKNGEFALGREGGHTENRIVHHKDITGAEIERALLETIKKSPNIDKIKIPPTYWAFGWIAQIMIGGTVLFITISIINQALFIRQIIQLISIWPPTRY